jgi:hypothetical protein
VRPPPGADGIHFRRLLCFEPHWRGLRRHPSQAVEELYQALAPFLGGALRLNTVAMPLLATGSIGCEVEAMVEPMVDGALRWMLSGVPLRAVRIVCYDADSATRAQGVFQGLRERYARHDVFISYCHQDARRVVPFCDDLRSRLPHLRLFRDSDNLKPGMNWRDELIRAIRTSTFFVPFYSPHYLNSDMCMTEFYMALMGQEQTGQPHFFPILLADARLTRSMSERHYEDGRLAATDRLPEALARLLDRLRG